MTVPRQLQWYDDKENTSPWIKALAEVRHRAAREGYCYPHVQAIIVAIDQYEEAATGNRDYFLDKPYSIGGSRRSSDVPLSERSKLSDRGLVDFRRVCDQMGILNRATDTIQHAPVVKFVGTVTCHKR